MNRRSGVRRPTFGDIDVPTPLYLPVSFVVLGLVTCAALVILIIGARSPYTHANLGGGYDPRYARTEQTLVSEPTDFAGLSRDFTPGGADALMRGASRYVTQGCASCHGLEARGGPVAPGIVGIDQTTIAQRVRQGPLGMPRFSMGGLTDDEVADIAAYLRSLGTD